jgi:WD40 repeat protein/serine/threonine protein kinase
MPQPSEHEIEVFNVALELPVQERSAYLDRACAGDAALRQRIEELLKASAEACSCLEDPAAVSSGPGGSVRQTPIIAEKPGDRIGRYKLLQQIGEGGCGVVYMAEQEEPVHRRVALKVIKLGMDTKSVIARFEAERQALALMDHPNIAKVLDAGATDTGRPYFVMELVRGIKITDFCDQNNLSTNERLDLFIQVCHAIQHAHQKGIIHRDIKPSNVLVTMDDRAPVPKVIDFGIAKATQGKLTDRTLFTAFEQFIGTPAYMSPEQAEMRVQDIDTRSDIYSLGVLLYELLTGHTPFDAEKLLAAGLNEIRRTIREREPARPSTRLSTMLVADLDLVAGHRQVPPPKLIHLVRGDLDWIVMKCLEKDRTRRYDTANGVAMDIARHLNNEPVVACPPGKLYKFQKLVRRNKLVFIVASVVIAALIIGLGVSTWMFFKEQQARQQTEAERRIAVQSQQIEAQQRREAEAARAEEARQRGIASEQEMLARRRFYDAQMNLANQAWEAGQLARTADLLETQQPHHGEADLRSFEWYYLWGLCNGRLLHTIRAHNNTVNGVAFSPDATTVASGSTDGTICLWDAATGRRRLLLTPGTGAGVMAVAFSPDGKTLASGDSQYLVRLWDVASGKMRATLAGQSPPVPPPQAGASYWVRSLAFSPDGKVLASGSDPGPDGIVVRLWDLATDQVLASLKGNKGPVMSIAFSPDGSTLAAGSGWGDDQGACFIWSLTNSTYQPLANLGNAVSLSFSADGKVLAVTTADGFHLWDATTWKLRGTFKGHMGKLGGVSLLPDDHSFISCGVDRTVRLWQWLADDTSNAVSRVIGAHLDAEICLAVARDGSMLATGANDGTVRLWNIAEHDPQEDSKVSAEFKYGDDGGSHDLQSLLPLPDRKRVLVVTQDGAEFRDLTSGHRLASWPDAAGRGTLSPDGKLLAIGNKEDGTFRLWEVATEKLIATVKTEYVKNQNGAPVLAFSPDGRVLASGWGADGGGMRYPLIRLWDATAGLKAIRTIDTGAASIDALSFSPDGQTLAASPGQSEILLFDASTGQAQANIPTADAMLILSIVFSPDNKTLASGREGGVACLWDTQTGALLKEFKGHSSAVLALAFSPDGGTLASGGEDATVRLWDVQTGQERVTLTSSNSQDGVSALAFVDGSTLIAGFQNGLVCIRRGVHNPEADVESVTVEQSGNSGVSFLQSKADGLARRAQWKAAIATTTNLIESDPAGDNSYRLATLLVVSEDLAGYRRLCPAILAKFKGTTDPYVANRAAKACLILPSSDADLKEVVVWADTSVREGTSLAELPWFQLTKGLAEYRLGHFTNALEWAQKVSLGGNPGHDAEACAVLAMAHYQLQQSDEAHSALAKGVDIIETKLPKADTGDIGEDWWNWIIAHALMDEAKDLINGGSKTKSPDNSFGATPEN